MGVGVCAFIALAFDNRPSQPILLVSGATLFVFAVFWLLRDSKENRWLEGGYFWLLRKRPDEDDPPYTPRLRENQGPSEYGTNKPPTVDEVRDLSANSPNNWVPSRTPRKR